MIALIDKNTPTSDLLEIKIGSEVNNGNISGFVKDIKITDTDELWLFIFYLDNETEFEIIKIKNIC